MTPERIAQITRSRDKNIKDYTVKLSVLSDGNVIETLQNIKSSGMSMQQFVKDAIRASLAKEVST